MLALTPPNIVAGFKMCGVHPFYQNGIFTFDPVYADSSGETPPSI